MPIPEGSSPERLIWVPNLYSPPRCVILLAYPGVMCLLPGQLYACRRSIIPKSATNSGLWQNSRRKVTRFIETNTSRIRPPALQ